MDRLFFHLRGDCIILILFAVNYELGDGKEKGDVRWEERNSEFSPESL